MFPLGSLVVMEQNERKRGRAREDVSPQSLEACKYSPAAHTQMHSFASAHGTGKYTHTLTGKKYKPCLLPYSSLQQN